jgi:hypothetical protein
MGRKRLGSPWSIIGMAMLGLAACGGAAATGQETTTLPSDKVFVCKYVGTPGVDERLQTGDNPISVSINAVQQPIVIGAFFNDAQGRSVVIAFDVGQVPEPSRNNCPEPPPPPTTSTSSTTSTTEATTSTSTSTTSTTIATTTSTSSTTTSTSSTSSTTSSSTTSTTVEGTTTTSSPPPPPVLDVDFLTPICDGDVPYLTYSASFGDATRVARITFVNPDGPDVSYFNLPLKGRVLWAGAVVGPNGEPLDWPGWVQLPDGTWIEADDGFTWVRPSVTVELEINPVVSAVIGYPPATPLCDASPPDNPPTPTTTTTTTTTATPPPPVVSLPTTR